MGDSSMAPSFGTGLGSAEAPEPHSGLRPAGAIPGAEACERCGHQNGVWFAPSPLWNAVMRGGCINGEPIFGDMVCAACFITLAEERGVAARFRLTAEIVNVPLQTTTPSGRVWDDEEFLWRPSPTSRGRGLKTPTGLGANPRGATIPAQAIETRRAETVGLGAKHESAVTEGHAPTTSLSTITDRAQALDGMC